MKISDYLAENTFIQLCCHEFESSLWVITHRFRCNSNRVDQQSIFQGNLDKICSCLTIFSEIQRKCTVPIKQFLMFYFVRFNGFFIESGAAGIPHSMTLFYERCLGWEGLCVEPTEAWYPELEAGRTCVTYKKFIGNFGNRWRWISESDSHFLVK